MPALLVTPPPTTASSSASSASSSASFTPTTTNMLTLTHTLSPTSAKSTSSSVPPSPIPSPLVAPASSGPRSATLVAPDTFEHERHYYPRVLNANLHPMVQSFLQLGNEAIATRYCHLHPTVPRETLLQLLGTRPKVFQWAGADLFNVTNAAGQRQMIVIETNSCPSGQKSMPQLHHDNQSDGYHTLMRNTFMTQVASRTDLPAGALAVVYDKNPMENTGYAAALANVAGESVYLVELYEDDPSPPVKFEVPADRPNTPPVMHVLDGSGTWHPIRAAFRYVTQCPWTRLPVSTATLILNPVLACLAGGRNKMAADKAYELFNKEMATSSTSADLHVRSPLTVRDVAKQEIPMWVKSMGGHAVVKVPYSNAGQGVYTITNAAELDAFMAESHRYEKFIVQSLVGNSKWSSTTAAGQFFHTGTIPNKRNQTFVCDLRMMVSGTPNGFQPVSLYARRALMPLVDVLEDASDSWAILGTNLSVKKADGGWATESERLLMMDNKDFNKLGLGIDDLIDGYVQTVLACTAIDRMCTKLLKPDGSFDFDLYRSINSDTALLSEILP